MLKEVSHEVNGEKIILGAYTGYVPERNISFTDYKLTPAEHDAIYTWRRRGGREGVDGSVWSWLQSHWNCYKHRWITSDQLGCNQLLEVRKKHTLIAELCFQLGTNYWANKWCHKCKVTVALLRWAKVAWLWDWHLPGGQWKLDIWLTGFIKMKLKVV